jgi:carboxylesterase
LPLLNLCVSRQGFAISLPLLPGHSGDDTDLTRVSWHDWYSVDEQAYQALRTEYEQVAVVGRSLGGLLAALLASRKRDIEPCGLVAPALRWVSKATTLLDVPGINALFIHGLRFMPKTADGINDPALQIANEKLVYPPISLHAVREVIALGKVVEGELPNVTAPTLIVHSRQDRVIQPRSAEIAFESIVSTNKRLVWFERSGHEMFLDSERDAVATTIADFLAKVMSTHGELAHR